MKAWRIHCGVGAGMLGVALLVSLQGASLLFNPLVNFSDDTTLPGTRAALKAAGLEVDSVASDPAVTFDHAGAHFGTVIPGDEGKNYLRTVQSDYATVSFVAEITLTTTTDAQAAFVGFGAGGVALFGTPDWSSQNSSASFWPETGNDKITLFRTANDVNAFADTPVPAFEPGTHRFRMSYDQSARSVVGAIDLDYDGVLFKADITTTPINLTTLFAADGWPGEPSKIFFGGDDGILFRDLSIVVDLNLPPQARAASYFRATGQGVAINIADLLSQHTSDSEHDPVSFVSVGTSGQGATVTSDATQIHYSPANNNNYDDQFSYTVWDDHGHTATSTIAIRVIKPGGLAAQFVVAANGVLTIQFAGLPGKAYDIERSPAVKGPWAKAGQQTAPDTFLFEFSEAPPTSPSFYRLKEH